MAYFRSDIDIIRFLFVGRDENEWVGGIVKKFFFTSSGAQRWEGREMGNTQKIRPPSWKKYIFITFIIYLFTYHDIRFSFLWLQPTHIFS